MHIEVKEKLPIKHLQSDNHVYSMRDDCRWNDMIDDLVFYKLPLDSVYKDNKVFNKLSRRCRFNAPLHLIHRIPDSLKYLSSCISPLDDEAQTTIGGREMAQLSTLNSNNQFFNNCKNKLTNYGINKLKTTFGETIKIRFDQTTYRRFLCWLKKYDKFYMSFFGI